MDDYSSILATYPEALEEGHFIAPLFGLAPSGVCLATDITIGTGGLLPHRFTLTVRFMRHHNGIMSRHEETSLAVCFLWHFPSCYQDWALPSASALWSSDFPLKLESLSDHLSHSSYSQIYQCFSLKATNIYAF